MSYFRISPLPPLPPTIYIILATLFRTIIPSHLYHLFKYPYKTLGLYNIHHKEDLDITSRSCRIWDKNLGQTDKQTDRQVHLQSCSATKNVTKCKIFHKLQRMLTVLSKQCYLLGYTLSQLCAVRLKEFYLINKGKCFYLDLHPSQQNI